MADAFVTAAIAFASVVAVALAVVVGVSWRRDRRPRFALLTVAFALLVAKGAYLSWGLAAGAQPVRLLGIGSVLDAVFLGVLYVALVKR